MREIKPGSIYRHFKGREYRVLCISAHTETGEKMVIYQPAHGDYSIYARPLNMFASKVDKEKYPDATQEYRFEEIEESKMFGKWISVMDALPPEYLTVLAYSDKHRVLVGAMDDWDWGWHITHWMPLPPPPREDNHES